MKKLWWVLGLAAVLAMAPACGDDDDNENGNGGTGGGGGSGGTGGGGGTGGVEPILIDVSGTMMLNPIAAGWYAATATTPPALENIKVQLVDPVIRLNDPTDPAAVLAETDLGANGAFTFTDVDVSGLALGMVITGSNADEDPAGTFATSTMGVCQPAAACQAGDITSAPAYIVPNAFVTALETSTALDLLAADKGFLLGLAIEPAAPMPTPLEDVSVGITGVTVDPNYLTPTLTIATGETDTTAAGAFVIPDFAGIATMTPVKAGYTFNPAEQRAGTSDEVVFQIFFVGSPET